MLAGSQPQPRPGRNRWHAWPAVDQDVQDVERQLWVLSVVLYGFANWFGPESPEEAADLKLVGHELGADTPPENREQIRRQPSHP